MNKTMLVACAAALATVACTAEEEETLDAEAAVEAKAAPAPFTILPACTKAEGVAEVKIPGEVEWTAAEVGKYYPLGSAYRVNEGTLELTFGPECTATISGQADFTTGISALGVPSRKIVLGTGTLELNLARTLKEGLFEVAAPGFLVKDLSGESKFVRTDKGDGDEVLVRCVTGNLSLEGRHFSITGMNAADEVVIRSSKDFLETVLSGTSGEFMVKLDRGVAPQNEVSDDGTITVVSKPSMLEWNLSPKSKIRISRAVPSIGERMSVAVMTFDMNGEMTHNYSFAEGRLEVNSGELVKQPQKEDEKKAEQEKADAAAAEAEPEESTEE